MQLKYKQLIKQTLESVQVVKYYFLLEGDWPVEEKQSVMRS